MRVSHISLALALLLGASLTNAAPEETKDIGNGRELGMNNNKEQRMKERAAKRAAKKAASEEPDKGMYFELAYEERDCGDVATGEGKSTFKCELYEVNKYGGEKVGDTYYDCQVVAIDESTIEFKYIWDCTITDYIGGGIGSTYIRSKGRTPGFQELISGSFATVGGVNEAKGIQGQLDIVYDNYKMAWFHIYHVEAWNMSGSPPSGTPIASDIPTDTCRTSFVDICRPTGAADTFVPLTICDIYRQDDDETPGTVYDEGKYVNEDCVVQDCIYNNASAENILGSGTDYGSSVGSYSNILFCNTGDLQMDKRILISGPNSVNTFLFINIECVLDDPCVLRRGTAAYGSQIMQVQNVDFLTIKNIRIEGYGTPPGAEKQGDTALYLRNDVCGTVVIDKVEVVNQFSDGAAGLIVRCNSGKKIVSSVVISDSIFEDNVADRSTRLPAGKAFGAGVSIDNFSAVGIIRSVFNRNTANGDGGGFILSNIDALTIEDSNFTDNMVNAGIASTPGGNRNGGLGYTTGSFTFSGCGNTASGNSDTGAGCAGDQFYKSGSCTNINNC